MAARDASPTSTSSMLSNITVQIEKQADARALSSASPSSSTPPTSLDDEASVLSEVAKNDAAGGVLLLAAALPVSEVDAHGTRHAPSTMPPTEGRRSARSSRKSVATYNVQILAGTAIHTPTKYLEKHHKNVVHGSLEALAKKENLASAKKKGCRPRTAPTAIDDLVEEQLAAEAAQATRRRTSSRMTDLRKEAFRNLSGVGELATSTLSRGLRRSASDSHLKLTATQSSSSSKHPHTKIEDESGTEIDEPYLKPKTKVWLRQGLYVGQHRDFKSRLSESQNRAKRRSKKPRDDDVLPFPMFAADRLLNEDPHHVFRDFKLPFDTYNPLPRKVKVDGWVKLHKNRFIGDASALWKRDKQDASQCYCDPEDGCGEACHNRIMAYECDDSNCRLAATQCGNRPFAELKRRAKGNRYDYGVEVADTVDRGYGVRAMRTFEPHQIIVEYAGEIITQLECERRMKQVYKKDKCYYLMSFDNKMIIDATRGTIARFVNHSCEPNCEMIKWTVSGEPRMALFAGPRGIMTGEELTYDYNFDPFSQKNIQQCRCGTGSCRGVLGPKPKKPIEDRPLVSTLIAGTKRKVQDLMAAGRAASEDSHLSPKRRKICFEDSATTKAKNANSQSEAAGDRLRREAAEHSRQIASRQNRAMNRSKSVIGSRRPRSTHVRTQLPSIRSTRLTTVSFKRKGPKASGLKAISQPVRSHVVAQYPKMASPGTDSRASGGRPTTPKVLDSDQEEDVSLNITPASLRSASRKFGQSSLTLRRRSPTGSGSNRTRNLGMYTVSESKVQRRLDNSR